ncbi:MAG: FAD-dependent oxidoreductase, partial [Actinobacteria bacterium]
MLLPAQVDVVVIGAGLSGLAAARQIQQSGLSVVIVESSDAVGGRVRTDNVDGFLLDRGFQVLLTAYPELATQVDMNALDLQAFDP